MADASNGLRMGCVSTVDSWGGREDEKGLWTRRDPGGTRTALVLQQLFLADVVDITVVRGTVNLNANPHSLSSRFFNRRSPVPQTEI